MNEVAVELDAVTFDFYGTLAYHRTGRGRGVELLEYLREQNLACESWDHQILYDVFARHGRDYAPQASDDAKERYVAEFARRLFIRLGVQAPAEVARAHAAQLWRLMGPASLAVFPDVPKTLQRLRQAGYPLAVISNWQCGLGHFCTELGLEGAFRHVLASAEVGSAKPDPGIFAEAARRLGVPSERILHVGDTYTDDVEGGTAAGFKVVLLSRQHRPLEEAAATIADLEELPAMLGLGVS